LFNRFPRSRSTIFGGEWDKQWAREKRVCSTYYFSRYFNYGIGSDDVSDVGLELFLRQLSVDPDEANRNLLGLLDGGNAGSLIFKLRSREQNLDKQSAENLIRALYKNSGRFPATDGRSPFFMTQPVSQAALLIKDLFMRVPFEDRADLALKVVNDSETIAFACECTSRLSSTRDGEAEPILAEADGIRIRSATARRISEYLNMLPEPVYVVDKRRACELMQYWEWGDGLEGPRGYLSAKLQENPETVVDLIDSFSPFAWDGMTGVPIQPDLRREQYERLDRLVGADAIASALRHLLGADSSDEDDIYDQVEPGPRRMARQFANMHRMLVAQRLEAAEPLDNDDPQFHRND
jgi:hypothetical protein